MPAPLADRIDALEFLVISLVTRANDAAPGLAERTAKQADAFCQRLRDDGRDAAAKHLQGLTDAIRVAGDLPAND